MTETIDDHGEHTHINDKSVPSPNRGVTLATAGGPPRLDRAEIHKDMMDLYHVRHGDHAGSIETCGDVLELLGSPPSFSLAWCEDLREAGDHCWDNVECKGCQSIRGRVEQLAEDCTAYIMWGQLNDPSCDRGALVEALDDAGNEYGCPALPEAGWPDPLISIPAEDRHFFRGPGATTPVIFYYCREVVGDVFDDAGFLTKPLTVHVWHHGEDMIGGIVRPLLMRGFLVTVVSESELRVSLPGMPRVIEETQNDD